MYKFLQQVKTILDRVLFALLIVIITIMFLLVLWQVFSRYVLSKPSVITEEVVRFFLIWLGVLSAVYGFGSNKHIALTLLRDKSSEINQWRLDLFKHICILIFGICVLLWGGIKTLGVAKMQNSSILLIPMNYIYAVFPIAGFILAIYEVIALYELFYKGGQHDSNY